VGQSLEQRLQEYLYPSASCKGCDCRVLEHTRQNQDAPQRNIHNSLDEINLALRCQATLRRVARLCLLNASHLAKRENSIEIANANKQKSKVWIVAH